MRMPLPDAALIARKGEIVRALKRLVPGEGVVSEPAGLVPFESDGLSAYRQTPLAVVLPQTTAQVSAVLAWCQANGVKVVPRGAGTSLSGGALPLTDGIVLGMAKFNAILEVDYANRCAVVQPGVTNLAISGAVEADGFYYAPDPSSQQVCTIGGNVAENSGGAHCLKYGFTTNHVLAAEIVLPDGELVELSVWDEGPDLLGAFVGSEGTLGIATKLTLRVLRAPEAVRTVLAGFAHTDDAGGAVSGVIAAGILPAAIEMMDAITIEAAEAAVQANYPEGCGAVLIVELDGPVAQVEEDLAHVEAVCREHSAREIRIASDPADRAAVWRGRKAAFAAMGRVSPDYYVQDGVVPRTMLPAVLRRIDELSQEHGLRVGNVFHAGDGNLHPLVLYDGRVEGEAARAEELAQQILVACVDAGGSITGEHGVGNDKACAMPLMFGEQDLAAMQRLRRAFDPEGLANPGKLFPTPRLCGEVPGPYRAHPLEKAGLADRF
jgi:glycolate oxidase